MKDIVSSENYPLPIREAIFVAVDSYKRVEHDQATIARVLQDLRQTMEVNSVDRKIMQLSRLKDDCSTNEELTKIVAELHEWQRKLQDLLKKSRKKNNVIQ